ncbi:unnamed protein product [Pseudo-nitzschia multistriata]|uniref:U3 small nucleolar RNA-associated protein 25 n=1 Tax=Pseudo-nitzschia multistriata TaxID=183589 RepID=A0A448Z471_9STRA|nr:unnamed protein product [Pseudo-nitzschia multistriata]
MGISSKDKKAKKAGPKGKKARRQAKLENRWGETAQVDANTGEEIRKKTRRGYDTDGKLKSALKGNINKNLAKHSNEGREGFYSRVRDACTEKELQKMLREQSSRRRRKRVEYVDESEDSMDSSDDDDGQGDDYDSDVGNENPMGDLLGMIRKKSTTNRVEDNIEKEEEESNSDSSDSYDDSGSDEDDDEEMVDDDETSIAEDPVNVVETSSDNCVDFFKCRFGRSPLNQVEMTKLEEPRTKPIMRKIPCGKYADLQFTLPQVCDSASDSNNDDCENDSKNGGNKNNMCDDLLELKTPEAWQASAKDTYSNTTREVLQRHWTASNKNSKKASCNNILSDAQAPVYSFLARYADVLDATAATGKGNNKSGTDRRNQRDQHRLQTLHVLNHVLTSRSRIGRNNRHLKEVEKRREEAKDAEEEKKQETVPSKMSADPMDTTMEERDVRDQGFTRPSVLVLLPTRGTCYQFVKDLYKLSGAKMLEEQEDRFDADYGELIEEDDNDGTQLKHEIAQKVAEKERRRKAVLESKGKEWNKFFGDQANQDDDFKIGISLIPKSATAKSSSNVSIKLYSDFFKSDIIVASPLGLKMLITPEVGGNDDDEDDDEEENTGTKKGNCDYLSSIEICLLQHSEMILMQNWDHVNDILSMLNHEPKNNNNTDFSRVRNYLLEGQGARWRQLILSSKYWDPNLLSTFKRFGKSLSGQVKVRRKIRDGDASISSVLVPIKQVFQKIPTGNFAQQSKARVDYFVKNLLPQLERNDQKHTLVFIPSYFDFCSLRNAFLKLEKKHIFVSVTEYSRGTEIGRGRARFLQGRKPIMLYTGRAHYFHRHAIKGIRNIVFLGLPEHPEFYSDYVNLIQTAASGRSDEMDLGDDIANDNETSCLTLFTKYEAHALERVVGSANAIRILGSENSVFMFSS